MSVGDELYSGAAGFGKLMTGIGFVIATIIGVIMIILGVVLLFVKSTHTSKVSATITNTPSCSRDMINNNTGNWNCAFTVNYSVNNQLYSKAMNVDSSIQYLTGQTIDLYYNPNDPSDSQISKDGSKTAGIMLIIFALILIGIAWFSAWIARKSKFGAAVEGTSAAAGIIGNVFRR